MAANLVKALPDKSIFFDINKDNVSKVKGARYGSVAELSQKSDVIITMLPNTSHVQGVCRSEDGVFANAKKGTVLIDCSTIDPIASKVYIHYNSL